MVTLAGAGGSDNTSLIFSSPATAGPAHVSCKWGSTVGCTVRVRVSVWRPKRIQKKINFVSVWVSWLELP